MGARTRPAMRTALLASFLGASLFGCSVMTMGARSIDALLSPSRPAPFQVEHPVRENARLAVLWIGHATTLIQIDDKFILTDPVFTSSVGQVSKRLVLPGLPATRLPHVDAVLISHMHFDHLSLGSLEEIEHKVSRAIVPRGGLVYMPNFAFDVHELAAWQTHDAGDLAITAVPVSHVGWRYGVDAAWMKSFTGYVIRYHGITVYFGGDTAYAQKDFQRTARAFGPIDLALLPIAPMTPGVFRRYHMGPEEALLALRDLDARWMVPIHFDTFVNSEDRPGEAKRVLLDGMRRAPALGARVHVLEIGEQRVFVTRDR